MRNFVLFILLATTWGGSYVGIKYSLIGFPPISAAAIRVVFAFAFLTLLFIPHKGAFHLSRRLRWRVWIAGLFMQGIPFALLFWAEQVVSAGFAGIVNGTVPLWTYLFARFTSSKVELGKPHTRIGLGIGFLGMLVMYWRELSFHAEIHYLMAMGATVGMAVTYAIGNLCNKRLLSHDKVPLKAITWHQTASSLFFLTICTFLIPGEIPKFSAAPSASWIALAYLGICSSALAWLIYFTLLHEWGAIKASAVTYCVPPLALASDYMFFKTVPTSIQIWGVGAVLFGVVLLQDPRKLFRKSYFA